MSVQWGYRKGTMGYMRVQYQGEFREAECGGNLPVGWVFWHVYSVNISGYYKPVLIKSRTQKRLNVIEYVC